MTHNDLKQSVNYTQKYITNMVNQPVGGQIGSEDQELGYKFKTTNTSVRRNDINEIKVHVEGGFITLDMISLLATTQELTFRDRNETLSIVEPADFVQSDFTVLPTEENELCVYSVEAVPKTNDIRNVCEIKLKYSKIYYDSPEYAVSVGEIAIKIKNEQYYIDAIYNKIPKTDRDDSIERLAFMNGSIVGREHIFINNDFFQVATTRNTQPITSMNFNVSSADVSQFFIKKIILYDNINKFAHVKHSVVFHQPTDTVLYTTNKYEYITNTGTCGFSINADNTKSCYILTFNTRINHIINAIWRF